MIFFTSIWGILFTREILNTKQNAIIFDKILYGAVYLNAFALAIPFLVDYVYSLRIALVLGAALLCLIYATVIKTFLNQKRYSRYFLIAWTGFFIGIFIYQFYSLGWLPTDFISTWSIFIGSSFEIILFALALAERINDIRKDKEEAQDEVIRMQKIAIENIKTNQKQQEQIVAINQELRIAKEIHESILPQSIPSPRGIKIHVCYIPMAEIGGDLYEFFEDPNEDGLGILIADVTGHGIPAAQVSSMVKAVFTFHRKSSNKPDRLLREMNTTLLSIQNNQMISAGYLYIDFKSKVASYANSGHPPLFLWRQKTKKIEKIYSEGKILGWLEDSNNKMQTISYQKGDKFFLYTDGITNTRRNISDIWGEDNFERFIVDHIQLTPEDFVQELLQTLRNYSGSEGSFEDDITFLYIEV
jgi:serine phosphatase RsbU (regulator of sigma subunit)